MPTQIYVNLPVKDLKRSVDFFTKLGYKFNSEFTDENATCMIIDDNIFVMLLTEPFFKRFTKNEIADATKTTESIICLSADSREKVDEMVKKALAAGATAPNDIQNEGPMYSHGYKDLDGHLWEIAHMDMEAFRQERKN